MVKELSELLKDVVAIVPEDTDVTTLVEDISDTVNDALSWKEKFTENDKAWKEKYISRFTEKKEDDVLEEDENSENGDEKTKFSELFEEKKEEK